MNTTIVKLKNGKTLIGILWEFRPERGFIALTTEDDGLNHVALNDCESAIIKNVMVRKNVIEDEDLLEKARRNGWKENG